MYSLIKLSLVRLSVRAWVSLLEAERCSETALFKILVVATKVSYVRWYAAMMAVMFSSEVVNWKWGLVKLFNLFTSYNRTLMYICLLPTIQFVYVIDLTAVSICSKMGLTSLSRDSRFIICKSIWDTFDFATPRFSLKMNLIRRIVILFTLFVARLVSMRSSIPMSDGPAIGFLSLFGNLSAMLLDFC